MVILGAYCCFNLQHQWSYMRLRGALLDKAKVLSIKDQATSNGIPLRGRHMKLAGCVVSILKAG
jgi:hypothetical protein